MDNKSMISKDKSSKQNVNTSKFGERDFSKSDLTQFLQKRILEYERKQLESQNQLDDIQ